MKFINRSIYVVYSAVKSLAFPENLIAWMKGIDDRLDVLQEAIELNDKAIKKILDIIKT